MILQKYDSLPAIIFPEAQIGTGGWVKKYKCNNSIVPL